MSDIRKTSAFLILERPTWRYDPPKVVAMRKEKPSLKSGQIAVKVTLRIDMAMFNEFIPEVIADLEAGSVIVPEVVVESAEVASDA